MPLPEVYSLVSENSCIAHTKETERSRVEVMPVRGGVEIDVVVVISSSVIWRVRRLLDETALEPQFQMWGLERGKMSHFPR